MPQQKAFTLYEMLIVLTISSILLVMAMPNWHDIFNHTNDKMLCATLLDDVYFARMQAQLRGLPVAYIKTASWITGQHIIIDSNDNGTITDPAQIIKTRQTRHPHGAIFWRGYPAYKNYLQFTGLGMTNNTNGTFWHCHANKIVWAIVINKAGLIHTELPDIHGVIKDSQAQPLDCYQQAR